MISVIVPIYKVEEFLPLSVQSLLAQKYRDFELILVDDGSPDRCGEIAESFAEQDPRVRVIHKENGGLSDARNAGLLAALGEYVAFVDSDDTVSPEFLGRLYEILSETGSDIVECGVKKIPEELVLRGTSETSEDKNGKSVGDTFSGTESPARSASDPRIWDTQEAFRLLIGDHVLHQTVWNKLYRRSTIEGILFEKGRTNEDEFWTYRVFGRAKKVARTEEPLYNYTQRGSSIMGSGYSLKRLDALDAKVLRQAYVEEHFPALSELARRNLFGTCLYSAQMTIRDLRGEERKTAVRKINDVRKTAVLWRRNQAPGTIPAPPGFWLSMARVSFWGTAALRTALKRGF